jgi:hypothetical protein
VGDVEEQRKKKNKRNKKKTEREYGNTSVDGPVG